MEDLDTWLFKESMRPLFGSTRDMRKGPIVSIWDLGKKVRTGDDYDDDDDDSDDGVIEVEGEVVPMFSLFVPPASGFDPNSIIYGEAHSQRGSGLRRKTELLMFGRKSIKEPFKVEYLEPPQPDRKVSFSPLAALTKRKRSFVRM